MFFSNDDQMPLYDHETIIGLEQEVADCDNVASEKQQNESRSRLLRALVHSKEPEDVKGGIAMVKDALANSSISAPQKKEMLYLLAVGCFRSNDSKNCRLFLNQCLEIDPGWKEALALKTNLDFKVKIEIAETTGIVATAITVVTGIAIGLIAIIGRK